MVLNTMTSTFLLASWTLDILYMQVETQHPHWLSLNHLEVQSLFIILNLVLSQLCWEVIQPSWRCSHTNFWVLWICYFMSQKGQMWLRLRTLIWRDYPGLARWTQYMPKGPLTWKESEERACEKGKLEIGQCDYPRGHHLVLKGREAVPAVHSGRYDERRNFRQIRCKRMLWEEPRTVDRHWKLEMARREILL